MRAWGVCFRGMNVRVRNGADAGRNFGEEMCLQSREECQLLARSGRRFTLNFDLLLSVVCMLLKIRLQADRTHDWSLQQTRQAPRR